MWSDDRFLRGVQTILAGGTGFRYLISKRHGMHMGVDVGFTEEDTAVYIQFGSAWPRS